VSLLWSTWLGVWTWCSAWSVFYLLATRRGHKPSDSGSGPWKLRCPKKFGAHGERHGSLLMPLNFFFALWRIARVAGLSLILSPSWRIDQQPSSSKPIPGRRSTTLKGTPANLVGHRRWLGAREPYCLRHCVPFDH
jgi:hypothetical protein